MKYMGSKSRVSKYIVPIIQIYIDETGFDYVEPFVGGANVIDKISSYKKTGFDINPYLISLLEYMRDGGRLPEDISFEEYKRVRENYKDGEYEQWYVGCVGFLASYNGRWFDGGYAKPVIEKTKNGERLRNYYLEAKRNIEKQSVDLMGIDFETCDYKKLDFKNCVIYCDPPYENTKQYGINPNFDNSEFWEIVRKWSENNIIIISEENAPDDFECIWEMPVTRTIKTKNKKKSTEKLYIDKNIR